MSGVSEYVETERSVKAEDTLSKSMKKYKEYHSTSPVGDQNNGGVFGSSLRSHKDRLVRAILGAYEQAFGFALSMQEDEDSEREEPEPGE